jgi:hypothetical protein
MLSHDEFVAFLESSLSKSVSIKNVISHIQIYGFASFDIYHGKMIRFCMLAEDQVKKCKRIEQRGMIDRGCGHAKSGKKQKSL